MSRACATSCSPRCCLTRCRSRQGRKTQIAALRRQVAAQQKQIAALKKKDAQIDALAERMNALERQARRSKPERLAAVAPDSSPRCTKRKGGPQRRRTNRRLYSRNQGERRSERHRRRHVARVDGDDRCPVGPQRCASGAPQPRKFVNAPSVARHRIAIDHHRARRVLDPHDNASHVGRQRAPVRAADAAIPSIAANDSRAARDSRRYGRGGQNDFALAQRFAGCLSLASLALALLAPPLGDFRLDVHATSRRCPRHAAVAPLYLARPN